MPIVPVSGEITAQGINNNFSYLDSQILTKSELPFYNVKHYGAVGNGTSDDTTPINNAVITAYDAGGGVVRLPEGTYKITSPILLKEGVSIIGDSMVYRETGGTIIRCSGDIHAFDTGLLSSDVGLDRRSITLKDFLVSSDTTLVSTKNGLNGIHLRYNVILNNVAFKKFNNGIHLEQAWKVTMTNVISSLNVTNGIYIKDAGNRISMYDCEFNSNITGIKVDPGTNENDNILVIGCLMEKNDYGAVINHTEAITFINNYIEANKFTGIYLRGELGKEVRVANVIGNHFWGSSDKSIGDHGINTTAYTKRYNITGNVFDYFKTACIKVTQGITEGMVSGNEYSNTTTPIEYAGSGYTPVIVNGISFDFKGSETRSRVEHKGATSSRPTTPVQGQAFYDTTLGKPIWYTGSTWKDAAGTTV